MNTTPAWYALRSLETTPTRAAVEADYPAPLFTRRSLSSMAAGILGVRDLAPCRIAMTPDGMRQRRRPPA